MNKVYAELSDLLSKDPSEEALHQYIYTHAYLLTDLGYGVKLVFSKPSLGSNFRADFALAGWGNYTCWTFVEIERSTHRLFTKEGLIAQPLNRAIQQINSWWIWLYDYSEYAPTEFHDLSGENSAAVVIGRRSSLSSTDLRRLQQLNATQLGGKLKVVTYDALLDSIKDLSNRDLKQLERKHQRLTQFRSIKEWSASEYIK